jgi:hypothetical protein
VKSSSSEEAFDVSDAEAERFNQIAAALVAKYKDLPEPEDEAGKSVSDYQISSFHCSISIWDQIRPQ